MLAHGVRAVRRVERLDADDRGRLRLVRSRPGADLADVRRAVEKRADELWELPPGDPEVERYLDTIGYLLGQPSALDRLDAAGARDVVAGAVTDMLRRQAQTRMTVLWFDNLQWADPIIRDLLAVIVRSLADLPFLLITAQRPDEDVLWPPPVERPLVLRVPLGPLSRDDAARSCGRCSSVTRRPTTPAISDDVAEVLVDRGGGNPLFLIELAALAATCDTASELPGFAAGADRGPSRSAADAASGDRRQRRRARRGGLDRGARPVRPGDAAGVPRERPRPSWPPTACSTSTAAGGGSAATSCARSPTRP